MKRDRIAAPDLCPECGASWDCEHTSRKPDKKRAPDDADRIAEAFAADAAANPPKYMTWRERADWVLARLFDNGNFTPSPAEIKAAYPFGMREYFPYKVWLEQVKWWKAGCPDKRRTRKSVPALPGQERLL